MNKQCKRCKLDKPLNDYGIRIWGANGIGYKTECKDCVNEKLRLKHDKEHNRSELLKHRFGITMDEYNQMFTNQGGSCAICQTPQTAFTKALAVDHRHSDGTIRGLLCDNCNRALGQFKDSIELLKIAIDYLTKDFTNSKVIPLHVKSKRYRREEQCP